MLVIALRSVLIGGVVISVFKVGLEFNKGSWNGIFEMEII